jgi:uncharacterized membrane protein HdeD (DUF308 family)
MENVRDVVSGWVQEAKKNAGWLVALGVLTVIAGILAIASPLLSGLTVVVLIGVALAIGGVARTIARPITQRLTSVLSPASKIVPKRTACFETGRAPGLGGP